MDAATAWLKEHDPDYSRSRSAWKDLDDDGEYQTPAQEIPMGLLRTGDALTLLIDTGAGTLVEPVDYKSCLNCGRLYQPTVSWNDYCSETCEAKRKRKRDRAEYMRDYRRRKAA